jgi:FKBP-type peptidyl-prolyl cis-trans isomerase FklB
MSWSKIIAAGLLVGLAGCQQSGQSDVDGDSKDSSQAASTDSQISGDVAEASYTMGFGIASNIEDQLQENFDREAFLAGLADRFGEKERRVSEEQGQAAMAAIAAKQQEAAQTQSVEDQRAGVEFLAENGQREGVTTTESGLQYEVLVAGDGAKPTESDVVTTHYHGTLVSGDVFDSSVERGSPAQFPVNRVIPGWTEALQLMPVGSKWRLFIPSELAYGPRENNGIPANSTLIFDVELLGIEDAG